VTIAIQHLSPSFEAGKKAFILTPQFPFMVIGKIVKVIDDYVYIDVESTHISELEGKEMRIQVNTIEAFYIEQEGTPIPPLSLDRDKVGG
jgi:hypothetical protein